MITNNAKEKKSRIKLFHKCKDCSAKETVLHYFVLLSYHVDINCGLSKLLFKFQIPCNNIC